MAASSEIPMAAAGPEDGFEAFFAAHYAPLARLIYRVAGDRAQAEELAAEVFWKLYRKPPVSQENLPGWLYRAGLRLALDALKKQRRRSHYESLTPPPEAAHNPEEAAQRRENQLRVRQALAHLKRDQAALLILRAEGHSLAEMAAILKLNVNSVGTLLARADVAFRKEYVKRYGGL